MFQEKITVLSPTRKGCGKKSIDSLGVSVRNLQLNGELDFFSFYAKNQKAVDYIIRSRTPSNMQPEDQKDIFQNVLLSLQEDRVLAKYDSQKSALNTFLTNEIKYCVGHILSRLYYKPTWHPYPSDKDDQLQKRTQTYFSDLNGSDSSAYRSLEKDLGLSSDSLYSDESDIESSVDLSERLQHIYGKLPERLRRAFKLIVSGLKMSEAAEALDVSLQTMLITREKIRNIALKLECRKTAATAK